MAPRSRPFRRPLLETLEDRIALSTIHGAVFADTNSNGTHDQGEAGVAGWTVFMDANRNSVLDAGEASTVTDSSGGYLIDTTGLPPSQVLPDGSTIDYISLVLEPGSDGRWLNTTSSYGRVDRAAESDAARDFGVRFQPFVGVAPLGTETRVNDDASGVQGGLSQNVSVAADSAGNYVVAWRAFADGADTIRARVFNADGTARTGDLLVGSGDRTSIDQYAKMPVVAMSGDGRFAVGWAASGSAMMRVYQGDGTAVTGAVALVQGTSKLRGWVEGVAMDGDGDFAVLYGESTYNKNWGWSSTTVKVQQYTKGGTTRGGPITVTRPNLLNGEISLAMNAAGDFVVVWDDTSVVNAQQYDSSGRKVGSLLTVASDPGSRPVWQSSVAMAADGRFVVAWSNRSLRQPRADGGTYLEFFNYAQLFSASGARSGSAQEVVRSNALEQRIAATYDQGGNVTFAYSDVRVPVPGQGAPYTSGEVRFRRLTADGVLEPEMIANTTTEGKQTRPGVAATGNGSFVVAWQGYGPGDDTGIFTQRYAPALMASSSAPTRSPATITEADAQTLLAQAIARWQAAGADTSALAGVTVRVADLGGNTLGMAAGNTIWLDDDAAGWGWFVDATPADDSEFSTPGDQGEQGRMDLLSVLMHEMGHLLRHGHDDEGVMQETLSAGMRLLPEGASAYPADVLFALLGMEKAGQRRTG